MNIFDIIGPVMIGPSSSHTAGACRIGYIARKILAEEPREARITLSGSFAETYRGHGTDLALIAGILGMKPDDSRLPESLAIARKRGLVYSFERRDIPGSHPNTASIVLVGDTGSIEVEGASTGGGNILINRLNGMESAFTGQYNTLIIPHRNTAGVIADVTRILAQHGINIGYFKMARPMKGETAIMIIETDSGIDRALLSEIRSLKEVLHAVYLHANDQEA